MFLYVIWNAFITYKMKHLIFGCIEISLATDVSFLHIVWIFVLPIVFIVLMHCHGQNVTKFTLPSAFIMQKIGKFLLFYLKANQHQIYRKIKVRWYESIARILETYEEKRWNRSQNWMIHSLLQSTIALVLFSLLILATEAVSFHSDKTNGTKMFVKFIVNILKQLLITPKHGFCLTRFIFRKL